MPTKIGFRICQDFSRPDTELMEGFRNIPTSNINDEMNRMFNMSAAICPINHVKSFVGPAFTVKVPIGDNLMIIRRWI